MVDSGNSNRNTINTVQVALRIRPLMQTEIARGWKQCIETFPAESQVKIKDMAFTYNHVFSPNDSQRQFYDTAVKGLIGNLFQGYNVTILAYGQTGSGKTYAMGTNYPGPHGDDSINQGVIPQSIEDIFDLIETQKDEFVFKVNVSFIELYQEQFYDLLSVKGRGRSVLEIREDSNKGVFLPGLTELAVTSTMETMSLLEKGSSGRVTGPTAINHASSRSHAVFTITVYKESRSNKNIATKSKFHLVDLAGSERIKKTNTSGKRLQEGMKINQSLLALGNVISALGEGNSHHIGYRNSKLTRLLQDSLGGNSFTLMVACVSPADYYLQETVSTLQYADRARKIRNQPVINQDPNTAEIVRLNNLVNELRLQLIAKPPTDSEQTNEKLIEENNRLKDQYAKLKVIHRRATDQIRKMVFEHTDLSEKIVLAETAKDEIEEKVNELTQLAEQCDQTIDSDKNKDDEIMKAIVLDYVKEINTKLKDLQSFYFKMNEELINHEITLSLAHNEVELLSEDQAVHEEEKRAMGQDDDEEGEVELLSEDQVVLEEEKRAMGQVTLSEELQELNRATAIKESIILRIMATNKRHKNLQENEEKIAMLEKEKKQLMEQRRNAKKNDTSSEEYRDKVQSLEAEISDLKKKCQDQACIINHKEENESKLVSLKAELKDMKAAKVKLVREMRKENESFRKWKADVKRAMLRLENVDRKRVDTMAKMVSQHAKEQNVLKRKVDQAVAVNKRLKEALERQSNARLRRRAKLNVRDIRHYVQQEVEVHVSVLEAEKSLEQLMKYRAQLTRQIDLLRQDPDISEDKRTKLVGLEHNLAQRNSQISDLQQKIINADQENKSRARWDTFRSIEAKVGLNCLFELLMEAKKKLQHQSEQYKEAKEAYDSLRVEYENTNAEWEQTLANQKRLGHNKCTAVARMLLGAVCHKNSTCEKQQVVIQTLHENLDALSAENKKLTDDIKELRTAATQKNREPEHNDDDSAVSASDTDGDDDRGPELIPTPAPTRVVRRTRVLRPRLKAGNESRNGGDQLRRRVKRLSASTTKQDGRCTRHCSCKGDCSRRLCGCVKAGSSCGSRCKCHPAVCQNRHAPTNVPDETAPSTSGAN